MINDKDRDWGSDDRPWSAKHPTTSRILKGAAIIGGSLLALRFAGPQLLRATEGTLRRELSSSIGPGRRPGFLYNAFSKLGILERMPGISWDAAGRAIPRATEYEELAEFSARYGGRESGSRLSSTHHAVINSHGVRHLFGEIIGQPIATDEMMRSLSSKQLGTLRSFVSEITNQTENLENGWHLNSKWRPLQELHRQHNPNGNFDIDIKNWKAKWMNEAEKAQSVLSATSPTQLDNFLHMAVGRIQGRKNLLGRILGVQEADTRDFPQLAQKEQEQLEKQLRDHHSSVTPGSEWDPNPIRAGSGIDAGHMPHSGGRIDPNIYKTKSGEIIDGRVTGAVTGALWNEVKSGFQIPIIPYMKAYKPLRSGIIGDIGKSAKLTGRFNIGQVQPSASPDSNGLINPMIAVGDQLAELAPTYDPVHSTMTGMSVTQLEGNYERVPSGSAMAQRLADITGLTNKKDNWLASLPGPIGKVLGKVGDYLDLGMQATPSEFERQSSRISKFANPQYGGNLVKRIWSDPAEAEFSDAIAKKNALQSSFTQVGSLSKDSAIYKELHDLASRTVYNGGLDTVAQLENMHDQFSTVNYNEIRSNKLSYLLSQSFDDIRGSRKLDKFREAIAEEMMLTNVVSKTDGQRDLISLLSTGMSGNIGPSNSKLIKAFGNDLPANLGAKSWMTGSLLSNITDQNAELVLRQLRDKSSGSIVRKQVEEYVYNRAFPALSTWMPPEERTYDGTAFVAIKKGPNLLPDTKKPIMESVYEMMTNWNEHLHQLGSSRNGEREITTATVGASSPFAKASQINNYLSHIGMGLSPDSLGSGVDALKNIALKRVLPIAAGTFYAGYTSWEIRRLLYGKSADEEGNAPGPLTNLRAHLGIGWTWLKQVTGVTNLQKEAIDFIPGLDNYLQPKNVKEYKEYLKNGYDQVRQGAVGLAGLARVNFFNDTPVYGGKTMFWKPSWYAMDASDAKFSETGETRDEFYSRAWLPTPRHLLSPLKRLTDPYWFERVHAEDRPYPVTGDMFAGSEKYFGPLGNLARPFETIANATIGRILKPKRVIDQVYDNLADVNEKIASRESGGGYSGAPSFLHRILGNTATADWKTKSAAQNWLGGVLGGGSPYQGNYSSIGAGSTSSVAGWNGFTYGETPDDYNRDDVPQGGLLRSTPLGKNTLYQTTTNNLYERMASINKTIHGKANVQRLGALEAYRRPKGSEWWDAGDVEPGPGVGEQASAVLTSLANVGGLTGQVNRLVRTLTGEALFKGDSHAVDDPVARLESADLGYGGHRNKGIDYVNELDNRQPGWLPGEEGYVNFRKGDPYSKIRNGETRLPGAGYEKLHNVKVMQTRASSLGKSVDDIIGGMLNIEQPMSKYAEEAADAGTRIHGKIQRRWQSEGLAESVEEEMYNKRDGISGHLDAILKLPEGRTVVDIKTVNSKRYKQAQRKPFEEHLDQVNWYMHEKGISRGAIMYLNRDDPEETTVKYFGYSGRRYNSTMNKVASARNMIRSGMADGSISRGDLYSPLDRFKILADTSPFAEQTKIVASQLSNKLDPDSKEWEEFQATKDRLQKQKQSYNLYPYRFGRESSIVQHRATIDKVIDANTFTIKEDPLHPIKFAGIRVSQKMVGETEVSRGLSGSLHNMAREARRQFMGYDNKGPIRFFGRLDYALDYGKTDRSTDARDKEGRRLLFDPLVKVGKILKAGINPGKRDLEWDEALARVGIKPGARVDLKSDPGYKPDSLNTERALVFAGGRNVNAELLDRNWAKKQRDKYSPVQNLLFYSPMERVLGRVGEAIAHADTPFNDKFLRSRSPIEEYERGELYGKTGGSWSHPFRDKIVPAAHRMWHQNPLSAMLTGAAIAGAFWQTPGKQYETNILEGRFGIANDKVRLAIMGAGAAVGLIGSTIVNAVHSPNNPWIPERRRKEHDLQEYFDTLDYVKSKSLAKKYKELAYEKEGINVDEILYKTRMRAIGNKRDRQALEFEKAELRKSGRGRTDAKIKEINLALKNIAENETVQGLAPYAARAVAYEHAAEKTMYGLPSWSTVGDRLIAIPRKHRQLVTETMQHGTAAEKRRLVRELPNAEARVIGRQLDPEYQPEQRQNLVEYFQHHYMPRNQWAGYDEDQRLAMAQAKEIQRMGMDPNDAGPMYHNQFVAGLRHPLTVGPFDTSNEPNARNVKDALYDLLGDHVDGLDINVHASNMRGRTKVHSDLGRDRSDDYTDYMNKHRQSF